MDKKEIKNIDERDRKELLETLKEHHELSAPGRMENLYNTAAQAMLIDPYRNKDIYLVLRKTNTLDAIRQPKDQIFVRLSCPTPGYNQDVFKYHYKSGTLEYLWSIPRKYRYWQIWHNKFKYLQDKNLKRLTGFVISMQNGDLLKWVKKENGELPDAVISVNKPLIEA